MSIGNESTTESDEDELMGRVVWMYFMGDRTQRDIADELGMTRLRVNKLIGQARENGLVHIDINIPMLECIELEEALKERYELQRVRVVPTLAGEHILQRTIGESAAKLLGSLLQPEQTIGVGWGHTLVFAGRRLKLRALHGMQVVGLMGCISHGAETNTFHVTSAFSKALNAESFYMTAPVYCPSSANRDALLSHYGIADVAQRAAQVDIALVSCGDMSRHSQLVRTATIQEAHSDLVQQGAIGDLLGVFLDAQGKPLAHSLNQRVVGLQPEALRKIPVSILASGGAHKLEIVRAILSKAYVNHLVTDSELAKGLLRA
jgi:DNA-binding transcriptional regulator LsrR (DeoR family)